MAVRTNADTPEQTRERDRVWRRRHRPVPHRAHVLRGRSHRRDARDDPGRDARGTGRRRSPSCCRTSATTSPASSGRSRATRRRSGSWIRRCTSSCRTRRSSRPSWRRRWACRRSAIHAARRAAARVQPDARLPRLPPGHRLPGDLRDAGARGVRSRGDRAEGRHQGPPRDHDSARRLQEGARPADRGRAPGGARGAGRAEGEAELHGRAR